MADITKLVDKGIPPTQRTQNFKITAGVGDFSGGDILMVKDSLGHLANDATIEVSGADLQVRMNVYREIFPLREQGDGMIETFHLPNVARGNTYKDPTAGTITIEDGTTYELSNEFPISDIEILTSAAVVSGCNIDIWVS